MKEYYRVQANVNLDAIRHNILDARAHIAPGTKLMAIIKADGYGHGATEVAAAIDDLADAYGIAILEEGVELRRAGVVKPILILGYSPASQYEELIDNDITQTVFTYEMAKKLSDTAVKLGKEALVHIKIDTGMGRIGLSPTEESADIAARIQGLPGIRITGCFTHFATADEKDKTFAKKQLSDFLHFADMLRERGISNIILHVSNSAGIIDIPEANLDMVRMGISLYGHYPSEEVGKERADLHPAMSLVSCVSYVKTVPAGTPIGYGSTFVAEHEMQIATIPVGYGDGYPRQLSNKGSVLIHGQRASIVGRVCMDQFMVDVTAVPQVMVGDEVVLFGRQNDQELSVEEVSALAGSFNYEMLCNVGKRIPRVYFMNGRQISTRDYF